MIFVDSSFFIALANEKDQWHKNALELSSAVEGGDAILISDLVLSETVTCVGSLKGGKEGKIIHDYLRDNCKIVFSNEELYDRAIVTFLKYDGTISFSDAVSIEVVHKYDISKIVSFDSDFDKVGGILRVY